MVNFYEVRTAQLCKFTLLTSTLGSFRSFRVCLGARERERERESGVRKATGSYRTYTSLVKLQSWFLSLWWKTCPWAEHSGGDDDDDDDDGGGGGGGGKGIPLGTTGHEVPQGMWLQGSSYTQPRH